MHKPVRWREDDGVRRGESGHERPEAELLALEDKYCSHGDTVHYINPPKIFDSAEGSFLFDAEGRQYLDLQMWYSAVNFGYRNPRLDAAVRRQLDRLPQLASQYLHREKIELAALIAQDAEKRFGLRAASTSTSAAARRSRTASSSCATSRRARA
jgi:4-aminobutyrate aminotransferase-like enzyme